MNARAKPCTIALHAVYSKETIELAAVNSVFLPVHSLLSASFYYTFYNAFALYFSYRYKRGMLSLTVYFQKKTERPLD